MYHLLTFQNSLDSEDDFRSRENVQRECSAVLFHELILYGKIYVIMAKKCVITSMQYFTKKISGRKGKQLADIFSSSEY